MSLQKENLNLVVERLRAKIKLISGWDEYYPGIEPKQRIGGETSDEHLLWMLNEIQTNYNEKDDSKYQRWLGFIQGVMVAKGHTTATSERELTRGLP